jgi:hypothetical protein
MRSVKIATYPPAGQRPPSPRRSAPPRAAGFAPLLWATLAAAAGYLSGTAGLARHDVLYAALLVAIWSFYFGLDVLLRTRRIGPLLRWAGRLLLLAVVFGFFGGVYWLILTHG